MVIRSSTITTRPPPANSRAPPAGTSRAPARLSSRCRELSPDWSATARHCRSTATTRAGVPVRRSSPAAASAIRRAGSCPRARTAQGADGTGTSDTGVLEPPTPTGPPGPPVTNPAAPAPLPQPVASPTRTAPASAAPRGPASISAPRSLWARSTARTSSSYGAAACTTGSPGGSGSGRTRLGTAPVRAARHSGQSTVRGVPQPPHSAGSTRSVRSCHHPRMSTTVPTPERPCHPCGQLPVDNSGQPQDRCHPHEGGTQTAKEGRPGRTRPGLTPGKPVPSLS